MDSSGLRTQSSKLQALSPPGGDKNDEHFREQARQLGWASDLDDMLIELAIRYVAAASEPQPDIGSETSAPSATSHALLLQPLDTASKQRLTHHRRHKAYHSAQFRNFGTLAPATAAG
jgi:hypothetical protein